MVCIISDKLTDILIQLFLSIWGGLVPGPPVDNPDPQMPKGLYLAQRSTCVSPVVAYGLQQGVPAHRFIDMDSA